MTDRSDDPLLALSATADGIDKLLEAQQAALDAATARLELAEQVRRSVGERLKRYTDLQRATARAIERYNKEIELIGQFGQRAAEAMQFVMPAEYQAPPHVEVLLNDRNRLLDALAASAAEVPELNATCGIYFLLQDDALVYVGQSVNVVSRIAQHRIEGSKSFNRACYVPVQREMLDAIESALIALFKPAYNVRGVRDTSANEAAYWEQIKEAMSG